MSRYEALLNPPVATRTAAAKTTSVTTDQDQQESPQATRSQPAPAQRAQRSAIQSTSQSTDQPTDESTTQLSEQVARPPASHPARPATTQPTNPAIALAVSPLVNRPKAFYITTRLDQRLDEAVRYFQERHGLRKVDRSLVVNALLERDELWSDEALDQLVDRLMRQLTNRLIGRQTS